MTHKELSALFKKLLNNQCSNEEADLIVELLADKDKEAFFNELIKEYLVQEVEEDEISDDVRKRLKTGLDLILGSGTKDTDTANSRNLLVKPFSYAAAAVILICLSTGLFFYLENKENIQSQIANRKSLPILPGGNKAVLTLADGSKIVLNDASNGEIAQQADISIKKTKDGQLVYEAGKKELSGNMPQGKEPLLNTITTPKGGQYQVVLPDGTKVWLNAASSLKYPAVFNGHERIVELSGEAYFEVAKISGLSITKGSNSLEKNIPFLVITNHQTIEALGTHFNVNAYADEPDTKTALLEGSVRVSVAGKPDTEQKDLLTKVLKPGEQSELYGNHLKIGNGNAESAIAWKNGKFQFENEPIESVMRKIARWYDVDIDYHGNMEKKMFSGTISKYDNVNEVLKMLQLTGTVYFKINERRITVMA